METKNMTENSRKKLENKNLDMIVCNNLKVEGAGFQGDTNVVTVIDKTNITELGIMSKNRGCGQKSLTESQKLINNNLKIRFFRLDDFFMHEKNS